MRQGQPQNRQRSRGRGNNNNRNNNNRNQLNRSMESNGPDVRIRGTAAHIAEKYTQLALDAQTSGDTVAAQSYWQFAEHYNRLIASVQAAQQQQREEQEARQEARREARQNDNEETQSDASEEGRSRSEGNKPRGRGRGRMRKNNDEEQNAASPSQEAKQEMESDAAHNSNGASQTVSPEDGVKGDGPQPVIGEGAIEVELKQNGALALDGAEEGQAEAVAEKPKKPAKPRRTTVRRPRKAAESKAQEAQEDAPAVNQKPQVAENVAELPAFVTGAE